MYMSWAEAIVKLHNPRTSMTGWLRKQSSNPCQWSQCASKQNVTCVSIKEKGSFPVVCNISAFKDESKHQPSVICGGNSASKVYTGRLTTKSCARKLWDLQRLQPQTCRIIHGCDLRWGPPHFHRFSLILLLKSLWTVFLPPQRTWQKIRVDEKCCFKLKTTRENCLCPEFHLSGDLQAACRHDSGLDESLQLRFNVSQHHRQACILIKDDHNSGQGGYILYLRIVAHTIHVIHALNAVSQISRILPNQSSQP